MTIRNISKDKYNPFPVERAVKSSLEALILGLPEGVPPLGSVKEWRLISEAELAASEAPVGTLVSQGTDKLTINRRSIAAGIHQVTFTASYNYGNSAAPQTIQAFDYGFIQSIPGPIIAIIDGGSSVRWGSTETVTVDGSLSYDGDIGPGTHTGVTFTWSCFKSLDNTTISDNCFSAFVNENINTTAISINPSQLEVGKTYVLRLTVSKDTRSAFAEMSIEIAEGEVPQVALRYDNDHHSLTRF